MSDKKRIDLQKHVSPKVPRRYLIRIGIYTALVIGLIVAVYFMRDQVPDPKPKVNYDSVEEIQEYSIDTTGN